jgi:hypothetical protein
VATTPFKNTSFEENWLQIYYVQIPQKQWHWGHNSSKGLSPDRRRRKKWLSQLKYCWYTVTIILGQNVQNVNHLLLL